MYVDNKTTSQYTMLYSTPGFACIAVLHLEMIVLDAELKCLSNDVVRQKQRSSSKNTDFTSI